MLLALMLELLLELQLLYLHEDIIHHTTSEITGNIIILAYFQNFQDHARIILAHF